MKYLLILLVFTTIMTNKLYAQFEIKSNETVHIDSTSQEEREAVNFYKNYPGAYFNNPDINTTKKYRFTVSCKDGRVLEVKSMVYFSENKHFILYKSEKIYPENTIRIVAHFEEYDFIGIPNDICWLFRTNDDDNDPIYTYAFLPEDNKRFITFAKYKTDKNNTPLALTKDYVTSLVRQDETALEFVNKNALINAIWKYNISHYLSK